MADFPIYRLVKGNTLTFTEMDDNLRWLSRNMSGSTVTITGSAINMSGSVSIIGDVQITGTASIGFIKSEGYSTGSNQLGDDTSDRQTLIGIVSVSGSMSVFGNSVMTGSLAQGSKTIASGPYSHAEGSASIAIETGSHAEGLHTIASGAYQHVQGQYNATSSAQSAFIVGNGTDDNNRSNLIFAANNTVQITGSLKVLGSITGSLFGTASNAFSSSYALSASYAVSSSYAYTASSAISAYTASSSVSSSYAYTASSAISAYTASSSVSSSYAYTASSAISAYTASSSISSSYAYTASSAISAYTASSSVSSSYAITASHAESLKIGLNLSASSINITNNIVANSITAQSASFGYVQTITGSAVIIGQEYIILNTQTPSSRYAGLIIYDSGSSTTTASLVWDSQTNHFVYSNGSGSSYSGGGFIAGPKNSGSLADATYPTLNRVLRGQGDDHIYDSNITDDNSKVSVSIPVNVTGSVTATTGFTGSLFGTASRAISSSYALTSSYSTNISGTTNYVSKLTGINSLGNSLVYDDGTNVGINTASPGYRLDVQGTGRYSSNLTVDGYIGINATAQVPYRILAGGMIRTQGAGNSGRIEIVDTQVGGASLTIDPQRSLGVAAIYTNGAFPIAIGTNNTDRLSINGTGTIKLNAYTTNGFVKFSSSDGTLAVDTTTYQPLLNGSGYVSMSGTNVNYVSTIPNSGLTNSSITIQGSLTSLGGSVNVINGTGFVKASGTSITYDNSTYYLASNPNGYTTNTGTVTSITVSPGTGMSGGGTITTSGTVTLTNTAPDQIVALTQGGTTTITGTYPNFTITSNDQYTGTVTSVGGTSPIVSSGGNTPSISIPAATTSVNGYLSSTDWNVFSGKQPALNGTGFVKISGTTISYDNSTYYLASNPSGYTTNTGTLTSVTVTAGTGMSGGGTLTGAGGTVTLTNAAPDQVVALTQGGTTVITGTYPNFTITSNDQYTGTVTGTGTANYLSKFTGTSAIGNSIVYDNGTNVGIGTTNNGGDGGVAPRLAVANPSNADKFVGIGYDNTGDYGFIHSIHRATAWKNLALQAFGGNVGIGTTSPAYKLDVSGNIRALSGSIFATATGTEGSQYQLNAITIGYDSTNTIGWITAGGAAARTNLALQAGGGNVGIGTTTPTAKLEIYSGSGDNYIYTTNGTAATFNGLMVRYNSTNYMGAIGNPSTGEFRIGGFNVSGYYTTIYSNNSETVRVTGGNVGIGTTSPNSKLDVVSSGEIARLTTTSTTGNNYLTFASGSTGIGYVGYGSAGNNNLALINYKNEPVYLGSNSSVLVTVSGSGVGIGTTNPGYPLEISSTATLSIAYQRTGVSAKKWGFDSDNSNTYWYNITDDVRSFTLANGGNVGIGTTSPAYKLDVTGIGRFTGDSAEVLTLHKTSGGSSQIVMTTSFGNSFGISPFIAGVSNGGFSITDITNNVQRIVIQDSTGNVGIGTTSPSAKLDVSGNILANNFNSDNAVVNTADTYTGTAKITNIITLTQAEYNAIGSPSSDYLYVII